MLRRKRLLIWAGAGVGVVLLLVLIVWVGLLDFKAYVRKNPPAGRVFGLGVTVQVAEAKVEEITDVIGATSAVEALITVHLTALVNAKIVALGADLGDWVKKGQVLVRMDQTVIRAAVDAARNDVAKARADLEKTEKTVVTMLAEFKAAVATAQDNVTRGQTDVANAQLNFGRFQVLYDQKVIAKVELEVAEARLNSAKAALTLAQQDLVKAQSDLSNYIVLSQSQLAAARAAVTNALEVLARTERDLRNTVMLCPVDGIVLDRKKQVGETPNPSEDVFVVGTLDSIYVVAKVAEEHVSRIRLGGKAEVVYDSFPNEKFTGTITKIDPTTDIKTRTFLAYVKMDNQDRRIKPGLTAYTRVDWKRQALTVPRLAVVKNALEASVFVVQDGKARVRPIKVLQAPGEKMEVASGLSPGDRVIYFPVLKIKDNDPVIIDTSSPNGTPPAGGTPGR